MIRVKTHHVDITPSLKEYATSKAQKLDKFVGEVDCDLELDIHDGHSDANSRQIAKITLTTDGKTFHAEEASQDMYASIDLLIDKISKQLRRHRDKQKDHHRGSKGNLSTTTSSETTTKPTASSFNESDLYIPKPIELEQAEEILIEKELPFLVFRNFKEKIAIIYKKDDEEFGLIEP